MELDYKAIGKTERMYNKNVSETLRKDKHLREL